MTCLRIRGSLSCQAWSRREVLRWAKDKVGYGNPTYQKWEAARASPTTRMVGGSKMVQAYEVEGSGGGVWLLLTPGEFEIIFARFLRGMEAEDLRDDEIVRVMRGMRWVDKVVKQGQAEGSPHPERVD